MGRKKAGPSRMRERNRQFARVVGTEVQNALTRHEQASHGGFRSEFTSTSLGSTCPRLECLPELARAHRNLDTRGVYCRMGGDPFVGDSCTKSPADYLTLV